MKTVNTNKCKLLAVEVPEGVDAWFNEQYPHFLQYYPEGETMYERIVLPEGSYTILGRANEITEEQAREIMKQNRNALSSFHSLCEVHGISNELILKQGIPTKEQLKECLIDFQLYLYDRGLINDYSWDFEKEAKKFIKKHG